MLIFQHESLPVVAGHLVSHGQVSLHAAPSVDAFAAILKAARQHLHQTAIVLLVDVEGDFLVISFVARRANVYFRLGCL